jgi:hypothetical protein
MGTVMWEIRREGQDGRPGCLEDIVYAPGEAKALLVYERYLRWSRGWSARLEWIGLQSAVTLPADRLRWRPDDGQHGRRRRWRLVVSRDGNMEPLVLRAV